MLSSVWRCRYWVSCLWNVLNLFFKCHPGYANSPCFENLMFFSFLSKDTTFVQTCKIPINLSHHQFIFLRVTLTVCSYFNLYFNYLHLSGPTFSCLVYFRTLMAKDNRIPLVSFTGSTQVRRYRELNFLKISTCYAYIIGYGR